MTDYSPPDPLEMATLDRDRMAQERAWLLSEIERLAAERAALIGEIGRLEHGAPCMRRCKQRMRG